MKHSELRKKHSNTFKLSILISLATIIIWQIISCEKHQHEDNLQCLFPDVLNIKNTPKQAIDWSSFCFSDQGAWFGFALPDSIPEEKIIFSGPFLMSTGEWLSPSILELQLLDKNDVPLSSIQNEMHFYPGKLEQIIEFKDFNLKSNLIYISSTQALITYEFTDFARKSVISPEFSGSSFHKNTIFDAKGNHILISIPDNKSLITLHFSDALQNPLFSHSKSDYVQTFKKLDITETQAFSVLIEFSDKNIHKNISRIPTTNALNDPETFLSENKDRWNQYIKNIIETDAPWKGKKAYERIAVKSLVTLTHNWRSAYGDLLHDGLFPSYAVDYFNGFWAWDSWKHSVALVHFNPELAKDQIRCMYDYQDKTGMIPDCIYADKTYNNWLNSKPPLSGWAIWQVFQATQDTAFLEEMLPKLLLYHNWWYENRDFNKNQLCEYGSSNQSLIAAKWESGMDNAIRFDSSAMLSINEQNFAFNQESVDLNAYLYYEKFIISQMAKVLEEPELAKEFSLSAKNIMALIETELYSEIDGYYYDKNIETGDLILAQGPEGWSPLFTKLARKEHANRVMEIMLDTSKFNRYIPFPTAPADDPRFSTGYWRGPIWMDQVYFGITALRNYGNSKQADSLTLNTFDRLEGIKGDAPIRENYWPETGEGMRVNHFSWSAAHLLLLYKNH